MPATLVFDYPTIEEMAEFVAGKAAGTLAATVKSSKGAAPVRQQRAAAGAVAAATRSAAAPPDPALTPQRKLELVADKVRGLGRSR